MENNFQDVNSRQSPTEDRHLLVKEPSGTAPPPPTPEEHAFDQASVTSVPDSHSLGSLLAELLNQGKLPARIHAEGCAFKIVEIQEESPDAAPAVEGTKFSTGLTPRDVKSFVAREIAVLQLVLQRQLKEMSSTFSSEITKVSEIRNLHVGIKPLQSYSNLLIQNQEKLLYATFNKIQSDLQNLEHLSSHVTGRVNALEKRILQSMVTENKILDCVIRLEERLGKIEAGATDVQNALTASASPQYRETKYMSDDSPEELEKAVS